MESDTETDRERKDGGMWKEAGRGKDMGERWTVGGFSLEICGGIEKLERER